MGKKAKRKNKNDNTYRLNVKVSKIFIIGTIILLALLTCIGFIVYNLGVKQQYMLMYNEISVNISKNIIDYMRQYAKNNVVLDDKNVDELLYSLATTENIVQDSFVIGCSIDGKLSIVGKNGKIVDKSIKEKINNNKYKFLEQQSFIDRTNFQYSVYRYLLKLDDVDYYYCLFINTKHISQYSICYTIIFMCIAIEITYLILLWMMLMLNRVIQEPLEKLLCWVQDLVEQIDENLKPLSDFPVSELKVNSGCQEIDMIVGAVNSMINQLEMSMYNEEYLQEMIVKNKNEINGIRVSMEFTKRVNNFQSLSLKYLRYYDDTKSMLTNLAKMFSIFLDYDIIVIFIQNNNDLETCIFNTKYERAENEIIDNILESDFNKDKKWDLQVQIEYSEMPVEMQYYIGEKIDERFSDGSICSGKLADKIYSIVFLNVEKQVSHGMDRSNIARLLQICQMTAEILLLRRQLIYDSERDRMTHLYNRDHYIKMVKQWDTSTRSVGVMYLDVNNLKEINDSLGHEYGDRLIKKAAASARSILDDKTIGFRVGGDEFVIILKDCTDEKLSQKVQTLKNAIAEVNKKEEIPWCDIAIGFCIQKDYVESIEKLVDDADAKMYANKKMTKQMNENAE